MLKFDDEKFTGAFQPVSGGALFLLKTKNEPEFIEKWLKHYLAICDSVGGGCVIFDNESTDPIVLDIYRRYSDLFDNLLIYKYKGSPDLLHYPSLFPNLYCEICRISKWYAFLDTDEFLYFLDQNTDSLSLSFPSWLLSSNYSWSPTLWLNNHANYTNVFDHPLRGGGSYDWGKPLSSSKISFIGSSSTNHNVQFLKNTRAENYIFSSLLFHYKNLYPSQRIRSNYGKLIHYHGLSDLISYDEFLNVLSAHDHKGADLIMADLNLKNTAFDYLNEALSSHARLQNSPVTLDKNLAGKILWNVSENKISFIDEFERDVFYERLANYRINY